MKIIALLLSGPYRNYRVEFTKRRPEIGVIAGPISTGKSSILEFADYCLGADDHPTHPEIARKARSASLEIEIDGERWTIERPLFASESVAWVRSGGVDEDGAHEQLTTGPPSEKTSLSAWLVEKLGFDGTSLKVSDGNPNSSTHLMSFRDLMWLAFLPNHRLDNKALLHENNPYKSYKMRQVIEVVFGVHDQHAADLLEKLADLREERRAANDEIASLEVFLSEEDVPGQAELEERRLQNAEALGEALAAVAEIEKKMRVTTSSAAKARSEYALARGKLSAESARLRDRESLRDRLLPLRGQYAEDMRKLTFIGESKRIFDPLHVTVCPSCLQALQSRPEVTSGVCTLCRQEISASAEVAELDFEKEQRSLRQRIRELDRYTEDVEREIAAQSRAVDIAAARAEELSEHLDSEVSVDLSPYIGERDAAKRSVSILEQELRDIERAGGWQDALERRRNDLLTLDGRIQKTVSQLTELRANMPERDAIVTLLSTRFAELLREWRFPKLDDGEPPRLDAQFVPFVRGRPYREIGSSGALTLISVAWHLAIYELAIESGSQHPGFLMIDTPQKNLFSRAREDNDEDDEYQDPAIVDEMWRHILRWSQDHPDCQLIVVDNEPPEFVRSVEVIRFTRNPNTPPYGLIEDETSAPSASAGQTAD